MVSYRYAGFWVRTWATLIDTLLLLVVLVPLMFSVYGESYWQDVTPVLGLWDVVLNYLLPAVVVIIFWTYKSATPGKMAFRLMVVDAASGGPATTRQLVGRYLAYYVSILPLFLGLVWIAFDPRKQAWHDKLAGTVVIYQPEAEER